MMSQTPDTMPDTAEGLWVSGSELAKLKGVAKQTVSEKVARLVDAGKLEVRPGKGKVKLINVAAYDRALGETTDLAREQGARTRQAAADPATPRDPTFTKHQADKAGYEAEMKRLDLEERLGKLRTVDAIEDAAVTCGETVVRLIDQLALKVDEMAAAVAKEGVPGLRSVVKSIQFELRTKIADAFTKMAATDGAAAQDDPEPPTQ